MTLDDGSIFEGTHRELSWCMIRVAEMEGASKEDCFGASLYLSLLQLQRKKYDGMDKYDMIFNKLYTPKAFW